MKSLIIAAWESARLGFLVNFVAVVLIVAVLARLVLGFATTIRRRIARRREEVEPWQR